LSLNLSTGFRVERNASSNCERSHSGRYLPAQALWKLYIAYSVFCGLFLAFATPPFQTPDAIAHFFRATQIAHGDWVGRKFADTSGGAIDVSAIKFTEIYTPIAFHPEVKATDDMAKRAADLRWGSATQEIGFPNTSIYPAYAYFPEALTIFIGSLANSTVRGTYLATCLVNLVISVAITAFAIGIGRRTSLLIFVTALLPSTLMLYSSVSQEALTLPLCLLFVAAVDRFAALGRPLSGKWAWGAVAVLAACIAPRPPYAGLLLILFYPALPMSQDADGYGFSRRLTLALCAAGVSAAMIVLFGLSAWTSFGPAHSASDQLSYLLHHPASILPLAINTWKLNGFSYLTGFVGVLGWLDTPMVRGYYWAAFAMLGLALLITLLETGARSEASTTRRMAASRIVALLPIMSTVAMVFVSLYMAWTAVGADHIDGVQGRYFLAVFPILALALPSFGLRSANGRRRFDKLRQAGLSIVLLFPLFTYIELVPTVLHRFY
jgi:uncharacterized membrane protein